MAWPIRYKIIMLLMLGTTINFIDRVNISIAAPDIMRQTGWDKAQFGVVMSAFLFGYAIFQLPGGLIADRWSTRNVIGLSCLGFSLFTALTPLGQFGFVTLLAMRFLVGLFESASLPAMTSFCSRWVPRQEFGRTQMINLSGTKVGQILAYPMTTMLIGAFSWPFVFYLNAVLGFLWVTVWFLYATDTPREHPKVRAIELSYIEEHVMSHSRQRPPSTRLIFTAPAVLLLCTAYMLHCFIAWIFIFWFPTYLIEARGFSRLAMGSVGMIPIFGGLLGMIIGGTISDWLLRRGFSARIARARFPGLCEGLSMIFLFAAVRVSSATLSIALFVLFYFTFTVANAGYWTMPLELAPRAVGAVSGIMSTCGTIAGVLAPMIVGFLVTQTGSWTMPFNMVTACGLVASAVLTLLVACRPIGQLAERDAVTSVGN
ncbi:MAG: MFS transporter [Acidobacteria bacterium]|nr:MFS transporter [Acidobacteriota bacterium]